MTRRFGLNEPDKPILKNLIFFDVEASGLHVGSYPIELGWAKLDLVPSSLLIKRPESWTDSDWSFQSEEIHGISRTTLELEGLDAREVAERFHAAVEGHILVSDAVDYERRWLQRLLSETGFGGMPKILDLYTIVGSVLMTNGMTMQRAMRLMEIAGNVYPHTHRADDDAVSMAAQIRCLFDQAFQDEVLSRSTLAE